MIDPANVPEVEEDETLARFVFFKNHLRAADNSLKADAFMPPNNLEMSVTRRLQSTEAEMWGQGHAIAAERGRPLIGRGDFCALACRTNGLQVKKHPLPANPNHAHILGWPAERAAQKMIAQHLASESEFVRTRDIGPLSAISPAP